MLSFNKVTLRRGAKLLFENGTFNLNAGEKMGLVGGNGAGKSSLLGLLRGDFLQESGDVEFPFNWRVAHVAQEIEETDRLALEFAIDGDVELRQLEAELRKAEEDDD
ncbi:MAG TPA: ATP-binding cassette domain-containing protein, partial [Pedomonas sp.]|uniref:ATP-binding cassette domain-containing protein n=1 Tax=Pedomonas sp. TaxID=2976421 RepID=UPI002F3F5A08